MVIRTSVTIILYRHVINHAPLTTTLLHTNFYDTKVHTPLLLHGQFKAPTTTSIDSNQVSIIHTYVVIIYLLLSIPIPCQVSLYASFYITYVPK